MQGSVKIIPAELPVIIFKVQVIFRDRPLDPERMEEECPTFFDQHHMVTMHAGT